MVKRRFKGRAVVESFQMLDLRKAPNNPGNKASACGLSTKAAGKESEGIRRAEKIHVRVNGARLNDD